MFPSLMRSLMNLLVLSSSISWHWSRSLNSGLSRKESLNSSVGSPMLEQNPPLGPVPQPTRSFEGSGGRVDPLRTVRILCSLSPPLSLYLSLPLPLSLPLSLWPYLSLPLPLSLFFTPFSFPSATSGHFPPGSGRLRGAPLGPRLSGREAIAPPPVVVSEREKSKSVNYCNVEEPVGGLVTMGTGDSCWRVLRSVQITHTRLLMYVYIKALYMHIYKYSYLFYYYLLQKKPYVYFIFCFIFFCKSRLIYSYLFYAEKAALCLFRFILFYFLLQKQPYHFLVVELH